MSVKPPRLSETLELAVKAQIAVALEGELVDLGLRLLDRISPPNWMLEWSLPSWLGSALGQSAATAADLTLANVYGLAYIKLQDDLIDGEVAVGDRPAALLLSTVLHRKWLLVYARLFAGESLFWGFFEQYMAQWVDATVRSRRPPTRAFCDYDEADLRGLGERGAPLKICAAGACLLSQREELIPQLESALDHLLVGAVLLDHAQDWTSDLAAGRYNTFIAYASALAQVPEQEEANRRAVLEELLLGKAARPYFALLRHQLQTAADESRAVGVTALADYLAWLRSQSDAYGRRLAQSGRIQLQAVAGRVLGMAFTPEAAVVS